MSKKTDLNSVILNAVTPINESSFDNNVMGEGHATVVKGEVFQHSILSKCGNVKLVFAIYTTDNYVVEARLLNNVHETVAHTFIESYTYVDVIDKLIKWSTFNSRYVNEQ